MAYLDKDILEDEYVFKQLYEDDRVNEEESNDYQNGKKHRKIIFKGNLNYNKYIS